MGQTIDLADFLFKRLAQLGVDSIHGVPGDYNLQALDYIEPAGINWVGNANELNAGYAADGYARIKGVSALITAFGVGELSAINAIGAAYSEMSPVVHVVGTPPLGAQKSGAILHHSLGDGNFRVFADMYSKLTVAQANLTDAVMATTMIDRTLRECILQSRPVYIELPTNMVKAQVPADALKTPIDLSIPENDEGFEDAEVELILAKIYAAKQPFIIVDGFTSKYGIIAEADELVRVTGFPTSTTPFGKGIVNETYPNFHGIYAGEAGKVDYMPWADSCDLILRIGPLNSDINTFGFTTLPDPRKTITFHRNSVEIGGTNSFSNIHIKPLFRKILDRLDKNRLPRYDPYPDLGDPSEHLASLPSTKAEDPIDQDTFYERMSTFFKTGDIVMTETGTPSAGGRDFILPPHTTLINSTIWLSIGYMLGSCQGAALAQRDVLSSKTKSSTQVTPTSKHFSGRTILFEGDGSFQMTAQAMSDIIRNKLDVTIFLLNNDGYTIERWIHGMEAHYNDVQPWNYLMAPQFFGAALDDKEYPVITKRAANWGELQEVLKDTAVKEGKGLTMVEVIMGREDAPDMLKKLVANAARRNTGAAEKKKEVKSMKPEEKMIKLAS